MTVIELAHQVIEMRDAQRRYFRTRTPAALDESKRLEKSLDETVRELLKPPLLFSDDDNDSANTDTL